MSSDLFFYADDKRQKSQESHHYKCSFCDIEKKEKIKLISLIVIDSVELFKKKANT